MAINYNPSNWYWTPPAGPDVGMIYSSAAGALVPVTNAAYIAWLAAGNAPQPCPVNTSGVQDWGDLDWVLIHSGLPATGLTTPTQAQLASAVVASAVAASAAVVGQVFTDPAHQSAFQNAASIVNSNGGVAPSTGALATKFAALATVYGLSAANFATLVLALQGASLDLSAALSSVEVSAASATTGAQLATVLAAFETAIGNVVAEITAASPPVPISAPASISIKGVNA